MPVTIFDVVPEGEGVILPDYGTCVIHGWFDWRAYMTVDEAKDDIKTAGWIICPICLAEIVGIE